MSVAIVIGAVFLIVLAFALCGTAEEKAQKNVKGKPKKIQVPTLYNCMNGKEICAANKYIANDTAFTQWIAERFERRD
jgi:hypothetical protein